jgi:hypothetical protein
MEYQIIMRLNSYCIFSEAPSLSSAKKSSTGEQMSILQDLDPDAAKFRDGGRATRSWSFIWLGALIVLGGVAAWSLISTPLGVVLRASTERKVDALDLRPVDKKNEVNPINPPVSDAKVVAAPAVIRDQGLSSGAPGEGQSIAVPIEVGSNSIDRDVRRSLPAPVAESVAASRVDGGGRRSTKKTDPVSRASSSARVSAKRKDGGALSNRSAPREGQAAERDVDIITVLVK